MSIESSLRQPGGERDATWRWLAATVAGLVLWGLLYSQLIPFSEWIVSVLPVERSSHLGEAIAFLAYDTPKVLLLLTLVVFAMGIVRSFFSPENAPRASATSLPPGLEF